MASRLEHMPSRRAGGQGPRNVADTGGIADEASSCTPRRVSVPFDRPGVPLVGGGADGLPGLDALDRAPGLDSESHVEHDAAVCHASDGVEVGLDHLRDLQEQQGEAQDQLA
jgi:hypothetical protein